MAEMEKTEHSLLSLRNSQRKRKKESVQTSLDSLPFKDAKDL